MIENRVLILSRCREEDGNVHTAVEVNIMMMTISGTRRIVMKTQATLTALIADHEGKCTYCVCKVKEIEGALLGRELCHITVATLACKCMISVFVSFSAF